MLRFNRFSPNNFLCALLTITANLCACGTPPESHITNRFGADDREPITTDQYPWNTIGRVLQPTNQACTGTLVGRDLVLTAAHCVIDPETKKPKDGDFYFEPNYRDGKSEIKEPLIFAWWGTDDPITNRGHDWAILRTKSPIGETLGWLGTKGTTMNQFFPGMTIAGYSEDFLNGETASVHHNCRTMGYDYELGVIFSDCDTARGASGGPVLRNIDDKLTVVGIAVAERRQGGESSLTLPQYDEEHANCVIPSAEFVTKIREIIGQ